VPSVGVWWARRGARRDRACENENPPRGCGGENLLGAGVWSTLWVVLIYFMARSTLFMARSGLLYDMFWSTLVWLNRLMVRSGLLDG
jgi:hypothetical protein